jgi:peptide chain release factor 2
MIIEVRGKELLGKFIELKKKLKVIEHKVNPTNIEKKIKEIREKLSLPELWKDKEQYKNLTKEAKFLEKRLSPYKKLKEEIENGIEFLSLAIEDGDEDIIKYYEEKLDTLEKWYKEYELELFFNSEDDILNAYLMIHPGAGGTESQDWAAMLLRMYIRWAEKKGFKTEIVDYIPGDTAGIKTATIKVIGDYAYGLLKAESGVHRLVRISPFDSNARRHTSFASVTCIPEIDDSIEVNIDEKELKIETFRASGHGGQHVNKTDSAVRITHIPTGIVVQCQNERSQHKNKATAMKILKARLYQRLKQQKDEELAKKVGEKKEISWGNQVRSYIFHPYNLVKDHRTGYEKSNVKEIMDGEIDDFIYEYIKHK